MNTENFLTSKRYGLLEEPYFSTGYPLKDYQLRETPEYLKQMYESNKLMNELSDKCHLDEIVSLAERSKVYLLIGNLLSRYGARHQMNFNGHEPETSLHRYKTEIEAYKLIQEYLEKMEI
jgi:hypothetical protein